MMNKKGRNICRLELHESALDCILNHLSPIDLCRLSQVCVSLRHKCNSNHLWEKHIKHKWGRVVGEIVYKEWQWHIVTAKGENLFDQHIDEDGSLGSFSGVWPNLCIQSYLEDFRNLSGSLSNYFMKGLYLSLESGRFWFPAQLFKFEIGCIMPCYHDVLLCYDSKTDTFKARRCHVEWSTITDKIKWNVVRAAAVDAPPYGFHISNCLKSLRPGDHIEIRWKASRIYAYDWFYGVIGHLQLCDENEKDCRCHNSETLVVKFMHYSQASSKRKPLILSRKYHMEYDDRIDFGFFGGIRKLSSEDEIEWWNKLCASGPSQIPTHGFPGLPEASMPRPILNP